MLLLLGPLLGIVVYSVMIQSSDSEVAITAGAACWMGVWWLTEVVPLPVTSLLPLLIFPVTGVLSANQIASQYFNDVIFLFTGGFLIALAMEKWNLHKRIALRILMVVGGNPVQTLLGFMAATAFLSMWISNTATAMMMVPIAIAVIKRFPASVGGDTDKRFATGLLLGIAYSASIGGLSTLVGTPPNLVLTRIAQMQFPDLVEVSFTGWLIFALPLALLLFLAAWGLLAFLFMRNNRGKLSRKLFSRELKELGPVSYEEKSVLVVFIMAALLWLSRKPLKLGSIELPGWSTLLPEPTYAGDGTVAIAMAFLLFLLPSKKSGKPLLTAGIFSSLPWGIVLLFGGGFALAKAFTSSGLALWLGGYMEGLAGLPLPFMIAGISTFMTFLTELTSNTATTQMVLPILGSAATATGIAPLLLMAPATLSASCAFMMPVATPPNAIVFGTGHLRIRDMASIGILLNLTGIVVITLWVVLTGSFLLN